MSTVNPMQQSQGMGSPISNDVYNVIAALDNKMEGLEAYRKYAQDGDAQIWQYLTQLDTQAVQYLSQVLEQKVQSGRLRPRPPGQAYTPGQAAAPGQQPIS